MFFLGVEYWGFVIIGVNVGGKMVVLKIVGLLIVMI